MTSAVGLPCWRVGTYKSLVTLYLGRKLIVRPQSGPRQHRRSETGDAALIVWCSWRLDGRESPITSSDDTETALHDALQRLVGTSIVSVKVLPPAWDLCVEFSNGCILRVFCDYVPGDPSFDDNWEVRVRDERLVVSLGGKWLVIPDRTLEHAQNTTNDDNDANT